MKPLRALVLLLTGALLLTGCDFDVYKLPLPGGTDVGDNPITVTAEFRDVLDLVPKSTVKVNDVSVGQVTDVELAGEHARVTMQLRNDIDLPDNAIAELRQTSLLGEKFVSLSPPESEPPSGHLGNGDDIGLDSTGRNPEVEEVLGALSLVLNGGGIAQLKTIASEINKALDGREGAARSVLQQVRTFVTTLDDNKHDIVHAIDSVNRLAVSVHRQQDSIDAALDELPSALTSLDQQRSDLVKMLRSLNRLGDVGVRVIQASKLGTTQTLEQLDPVLTELGNAGDAFVKSFNVFLTYPFVDEVVGRDPQVARNLHMGDYTNLSVRLDLKLDTVVNLPTSQCVHLSDLPRSGPLPDLGKLCQGALDAITRCVQHPSLRVCDDLPKAVINQVVCPRVHLAALCPRGGGGGGNGGPLPGLPGLPGLTGQGGATGLGRAGFGAPSPRGPTMGQLSGHFQPALVHLLVPGMVTR